MQFGIPNGHWWGCWNQFDDARRPEDRQPRVRRRGLRHRHRQSVPAAGARHGVSLPERDPDGLETDDVAVTRDSKQILGVNVTVVHDQVFLDGELSEDTFDWFAQDADGNVW
jgi:hypothetical protein